MSDRGSTTTANADVLLRPSAVSERALGTGNAVAPNAALPELPGRLMLAPFDPSERVLWSLERAFTIALGADGWNRVAASLPTISSSDDLADFAAGTVTGVVDALGDIVADRIKMIREAITEIIDFYAIVYDADIWIEMLKVWTAPVGSGIGGFADFLKADHPSLYAAVTTYGEFVRKLDQMAAPLLDKGMAVGRPWSIAVAALGGWMVDLAGALGNLLQPHVAELIVNRGNPRAQGRIIGRVVARVLIEAVLLAMDMYSLVRGAAGLASDAFAGIRTILTRNELATVGARAERAAVGITAAGKNVARASQEATKIYGELATEINAYKRLTRKTQRFNKKVRDISGLERWEDEYIGLRLDAQHIIEKVWYDKFAGDFKKAFGWESSKDMDAIALHTEWHIRSGKNMAELGLLGADKEPSLTKRLQDHLRLKQTAPDGTFTPFSSLKQLFEAHADFYRTYSPRLAPRLRIWFDESLAKLSVLD